MNERRSADDVRATLESTGEPVLLVCWFDDKGAPLHPCGKASAALKRAGVRHTRLVQADGRPFSLGTTGKRPELAALTGGDEQLPALLLPDGSSVVGSSAIAAWAAERGGAR